MYEHPHSDNLGLAKPLRIPTSSEVVFKVSELVQEARLILEGRFTDIWLLGEISNFSAPASAHWYFSLKDDKAQIRCAMFRSRNQQAPLIPQNGMQIEIKGTLTVYPTRGDMQVIVEQLRPAGIGKLHAALETLKIKLNAEGLFAQSRKKPLPRFPRTIGVVTSPYGAAWHDVRTTLARRMPAIPLLIYPVPVQGANAAPAIAAMIATANARMECDVLILCRGGGSLEDLWAFNEEEVARAMAASNIPIISAIGHEVDITIADLVADLRAPTPTGAAELVCPDKQECLKVVEQMKRRLKRAGLMYFALQMQKKDALQAKIISPQARITQKIMLLKDKKSRLPQLAKAVLIRKRLALDHLEKRIKTPNIARKKEQLSLLKKNLYQAGAHAIREKKYALSHQKQTLLAHNPDLPLQKGYSIATTEDGTIIHDAALLCAGERIHLHFAQGSAKAIIDAVDPQR